MNSVLFHPSLLHIVTSGIERHVILHSPTKSSPCAQGLKLTPTTMRTLPTGSPEDHSRFLRTMSSGLDTDDSGEEAETIALFDECALWILVNVARANNCFIGSSEQRAKATIYS